MSDENFNLKTISYEEMFYALKDSIKKAIAEYDAVDVEDVRLEEDGCSISRVVGKDGGYYSQMTLEVSRSNDGFARLYYSFVVNTFSIMMVMFRYDVENHVSKELTNKYVEFMKHRFPESGYEEKREKYYKNAEIAQRKCEELLFF